MAKKRKKLTSAFENLDPDLPTELELRLEEELRSAYEAERLIEEGGGLKDVVVVVDDDETLTLIERGCDRDERNQIGKEAKLEKVLEQLTKEQLVEVVKKALEKDKELEGSVKKRFGFVIFKQGGDNDYVKALEQKWKKLVSPGHVVANVENRHLDEAQDQLTGSSRRNGCVVANVEKRHLDEAQHQLRISFRRDRPLIENVEKRHLDEAQHQLRGSSSRDRYVVANVEKRHLDESQDQPWVWSGRDRRAFCEC